MDNNTVLGRAVVLLCRTTEGLGLVFDLLEKMNSTDGKSWRENLARFLRKESCWEYTRFSIPIARNRFNPSRFIGDGWCIVSEETDPRSIALTELDLGRVKLVMMLSDGETCIKGEEKLKRLKASGLIRLDADIFHTLWENQHLIPESWKEKVNGNTRFIYFDGTVLRYSGGRRCVLCLCWNDGQWGWGVFWLGSDWIDNNPSAVLDLKELTV